MSQLSEVYEMPSLTHPSNTESDEDQSLKCWEEVKAETGFFTYKSFLEAKGLRFGGLLGNLQKYGNKDDWSRTKYDSGTIFVIDILNDGSTSISLKMQLRYGGHRRGRSFEGSMLDSDRKSITPLLQNLRSPPQNVPARIVFWSMPWSAKLYPGIVDALGLGLKIHPSFFEALLSAKKFMYRSLAFVKFGDNFATVARDYHPKGRAPPVLFIAGDHNSYFGNWISQPKLEGAYHDMVEDVLKEEVLESEIGGSASLHYRFTDRTLPNHMNHTTHGPPNYYLQLFSKYVQKDCSFNSEDINPLLIAMLPLLHVEILRLRVQCGFVRSAILQVQYKVEFSNKYSDLEKQDCYQVLDKQRFWLRRRLEALKEGRNCFVEFIRSQDAAEWLKSQTWLSQDESIREALAEARTVDAEVRAYMELQTGNLSVLESRKSMQLSNQQFDEAKRTKIFTILAFVYLPLNLTASIFGMNLQQLNQSGRDIWSFLVTALVALLVTGSVWFCLEQYNSVAEWKGKQHENVMPLLRDSKPKHSIAIRVGINLGFLPGDGKRDADEHL